MISPPTVYLWIGPPAFHGPSLDEKGKRSRSRIRNLTWAEFIYFFIERNKYSVHALQQFI